MAINTALLIAAPILQDYFSDNATDAAMSAGVITCYQDNSRTTLKNWYYQTGSPGAYTYTQLPNPLTLSAAGTITDANGNDTIPFWYPYSESDNVTPQPYYVTVDNSNGQRQFTRQNFPFVASNSNNGFLSTLSNLIVNNVFWRNPGTLTLTNTLNSLICPSQHDGFIGNLSDMVFIKDQTGATDTITFTPFTNITRLPNDVTPEYYMNITCGNSGSSETVKYISIPICLHVDNLSGYATASVTLWTQNVGGSSNNIIKLNLFQFLGTGVSSPSATTIITITPSSAWEKTIANFSFPVATLPTGGPGDDAWFLQVSFPVGLPFNMNIAKPSIYLSQTIPSDDFQTYEQVSTSIDSPRTGDIRTSINSYYPYGWAPMNNGSVGNVSSNANARANIDTWPLFSLLWNMFQPFNHSTTNILAQMVDSAGASVSYGVSAIADWNANNSIFLTKTMGQVLLGTVPVAALLSQFSCTFSASNSAGNLLITAINAGGFFQAFDGMPIYFTTNPGGTLPTGLAANTVYYVSGYNGATTFFVSTTFTNAITSTVIVFTDVGVGTNNVIGDSTGTFEGEYAHTQLAAEIASHIHPAGGGNQFVNTGTGGQNYGTGAFTTGTQGSTAANTPNGTPFNVTQPGIFVNMYMKL